MVDRLVHQGGHLLHSGVELIIWFHPLCLDLFIAIFYRLLKLTQTCHRFFGACLSILCENHIVILAHFNYKLFFNLVKVCLNLAGYRLYL